MNMNTKAAEGHPVLDIAQHVLSFCESRQESRSVSPMQLLKLVYLCHGWTLGLLGRPLVSDPVQAWKYGPVFPALYQAVKDFKSAPVTEVVGANKVALDKLEQGIIEQVCTGYGSWSGMDLSRLTHRPGSPWSVTWNACRGRRNAEISSDLIEDYYRGMAQKEG